MKPCVWYDVDEQLPPKTGYYLGFKGMSMGDDETKIDYYYWNAKKAEWRDGDYSQAFYANVIYWTDADPQAWYDGHDLRRRKRSAAEQDAWEAVLRAVEQYEIVRNLAKV